MFSVVHVMRLVVVAVVSSVGVMRVRRVVAVCVGRVGRRVAAGSGAGTVALPRCARAVLPVVAAVHGTVAVTRPASAMLAARTGPASQHSRALSYYFKLILQLHFQSNQHTILFSTVLK